MPVAGQAGDHARGWDLPPGRPDLARRLAAEGLGTFVLVFAGTGAVVVDASGGAIGGGGIAAAFGLVVAAMVLLVGHLSGAHLNPAVTLGFLAGRHVPVREVVPYIAAQIGGALAASAALRGLFGTAGELGLTRPQLVGSWQALVLEAGMTATLMAVILAVATDARATGALAAIAIGGTVGLCALVMGPVTGASLNPARSLGPAVILGERAGLWIYVAGPALGALVGVALYMAIAGARTGGAVRVDSATGPDGRRSGP